MTTLPLPPEIKSAEDLTIVLANRNDWTNVIRQRDIAIWNAAIKSACGQIAEVACNFEEQENIEVCKLCKDAVLRLKQKE